VSVICAIDCRNSFFWTITQIIPQYPLERYYKDYWYICVHHCFAVFKTLLPFSNAMFIWKSTKLCTNHGLTVIICKKIPSNYEKGYPWCPTLGKIMRKVSVLFSKVKIFSQNEHFFSQIGEFWEKNRFFQNVLGIFCSADWKHALPVWTVYHHLVHHTHELWLVKEDQAWIVFTVFSCWAGKGCGSEAVWAAGEDGGEERTGGTWSRRKEFDPSIYWITQDT